LIHFFMLYSSVVGAQGQWCGCSAAASVFNQTSNVAGPEVTTPGRRR